ncbi:hypothetical protein K435DRAFT_775748 [Dendrothele bispora CBS 962.96]|uniref:Uncharacterized protein n=1 Tax=Dendrothele bispora (strain CBS 962.96) TaxID=1314807 RepID=A0A4S8MIE4_DENBC|nr:hypothetical protein K435DRAFT_775748 [Dendrothele bispora CBS 962.96]
MKTISQYIKSFFGFSTLNSDSEADLNVSRQSTPESLSDAQCGRCGARCPNCNSRYRFRGSSTPQGVGRTEGSTRGAAKTKPTKEEQKKRDQELAEIKRKRLESEDKENSERGKKEKKEKVENKK